MEYEDKNEAQGADIFILTCNVCGIQFAVMPGFANLCIETHRVFFCPSGHKQFFTGEETSDPQKKALQDAQTEIQDLKKRFKEARENEEFWRTKAQAREELKAQGTTPPRKFSVLGFLKK